MFCGTVFRRIEEDVEDTGGRRDQGSLNDEPNLRDVPQRPIDGPPRPLKRKQEEEALADPRKFRRIQIICTGPSIRLPVVPAYECAFWFLGCSYISRDADDLKMHCLNYFLGEEPPRAVQCPLCEFQFSWTDGWTAWNARMEHIANRHTKLGETFMSGRPDFHLFRHLWQKRIIDDDKVRGLTGENELNRPNHIGPSRPDFYLFQHLWEKRIIDNDELIGLTGGNELNRPNQTRPIRRRRKIPPPIPIPMFSLGSTTAMDISESLIRSKYE